MPIDKQLQSHLLEQIQDLSTICILDNNYHIIYCNNNFYKLLDYTEDELSNRYFFQLFDIHGNNKLHEFIQYTLANDNTWKGEIHLYHSNQNTICLDTVISPTSSEDNEKYYIAHFTNATEKRRLIENLKHRAHRQGLIAILGQVSLSNIPVNDLLEQTLAVICGALESTSGMILELAVNARSALVKTSYNVDHISVGRTVISVERNNLLGYTLNSESPVVSNSFEEESRFTIPDKIRGNDKYHSSTSLLIGGRNYPFGLLILLSDQENSLKFDEFNFLQSICNILAESINRKNMEASLKYERELSRHYLDVAHVIIIVIDTHERILLANQHASSVLGLNQNDLAGMNFIDFFIPEDQRNSFRKNFHELLEKPETHMNQIDIFGNTTPVVTRKQEIRQIKWRSSTLFDEHGIPTSVIYAGEDITEQLLHEQEQKELEKQLSQAQKLEAIGMLAGGIAHDFNNILASILGFSELAIETINDPSSKLNSYLSYIRESGLKARDIIEQMQNINLHDDASSQLIMLPTLLKSSLKMLRSALPTSIDFQVNIKPDMPAAYVNTAKFNQLLMQLLVHSRDSINGKGLIRVRLEDQFVTDVTCITCGELLSDHYAVLSIEDDGPGLSRQELAQILHGVPSSQKGLLLTNDIVHSSHGHMLIDSILLDPTSTCIGSCIRVFFPTENVPSIRQVMRPRDLDLSRIQNQKIMIVDDENSVASFMGELFRNAGFDPEIYCDSLLAFSTFSQNPDVYDLIITDQTMPAMTGDILATKALDIRPDIPIILCTGHSTTITEDEAHRLHIRGFLKKPIDSAQILSLVISLLSEKL